MGALHAGHLSLVELARRENDVVVVSIFVNPIQFGPGEDFARYPRDPARDARLLHEAEVDAIYEPSAEVMYPPGASTRVHVGDVAERFEGASRPGHFEGVATVVTKLFSAVEPDLPTSVRRTRSRWRWSGGWCATSTSALRSGLRRLCGRRTGSR